VELLKWQYPDISWDAGNFKKDWMISRAQKILYQTIRSLLPIEMEMEHNHHLDSYYPSEKEFYSSSELLYKEMIGEEEFNGSLSLDVWIPQLNLGIEYQGTQHYRPSNHWCQYEVQVIRDKKKHKV
jgi:hypothetical protein